MFMHAHSDIQHILCEEECSDAKEGWKFVSRSEFTEIWRKADPTKPVHLIKVWDGRRGGGGGRGGREGGRVWVTKRNCSRPCCCRLLVYRLHRWMCVRILEEV